FRSCFRCASIRIFYRLTFVKDDVLPEVLCQMLNVISDNTVCSQNHICIFKMRISKLTLHSIMCMELHRRTKLLNLVFPVENKGSRADDELRASGILFLYIL